MNIFSPPEKLFRPASNSKIGQVRPDTITRATSDKKIEGFPLVDFATSVATIWQILKNLRFSKKIKVFLNKFIKDFPENCRFSTMKKICATLVAKSTQGNHFIFLSEMAQVILYGRRSTKHCLLAKQKSFSGAEKKITLFFHFSDPP